MIVIQLPIWFIADALAPSFSSISYDPIAEIASSDLKAEKHKDLKHLNEIAHRYHIAWMTLTDNKGKAILSNRPAGLSEPNIGGSQELDFRGERFVETSKALENGECLTIGFPCPSMTETLFEKHVLPAQLPVGTILLALILNAVSFLASYLLCLALPLKKLIGSVAGGMSLPENFPAYVPSELGFISKAVEERFGNLKDQHEKNLAAARSDLSGVFAKEVEERFVHRLCKEVVEQKSADSICNLVIQKIANEFIGVVKAGIGIEFLANNQIRVMHSWGLSEEQEKQFENLSNSQFVVLVRKVNNPVLLGKDELASRRLEQLVSELNCDQCLLDPIEFSGEVKAYLLFFVLNKDQSGVQKLERTVNRMSEQVAPLWHVIASYEDAYRLSRHDYLTGLKNRVYLEDYFASTKCASTKEDQKGESVYLIFEGDNFRLMVNGYGPRTIDKLIQELSHELLASLERSVRFKKASSRINFASYLYRVGGCRFLLVLEDSNLKKATELAEQVIQEIADKRDWVHGLPSWSVSCGIAVLSPEKQNPEDCFEEATIALEYVRFRKSTALVLSSSEVPEDFMSRAQSRHRDTNANLDPVSILQQAMSSQKTGILTVSSTQGKLFWSYLEKGKITKARIGKLCGDSAVVEFISSFGLQPYRLQDLSTLDNQSTEDLRSLGGAYLLQTPINELIDFSVRYRDLGSDAKVHLKTPDMIVHPTMDKQQGQIEAVFFKAGKTPNPIYLAVVNKLWELCSGRLTLEEIMNKMADDYPGSLTWAAADFLMQNKLIKFSRLRVSAHNDGSPDIAGSTGGRGGGSQAALATTPAQARPNTGFVPTPRPCISCGAVDPLSQKFCVHCGSEMTTLQKD